MKYAIILMVLMISFINDEASSQDVSIFSNNPCCEMLISPIKHIDGSIERISRSKTGFTAISAIINANNSLAIKVVRNSKILYKADIEVKEGIVINNSNLLVIVIRPEIPIFEWSPTGKDIVIYDYVTSSLWAAFFDKGKNGNYIDIYMDNQEAKGNYSCFSAMACYLNDMKINA